MPLTYQIHRFKGQTRHSLVPSPLHARACMVGTLMKLCKACTGTVYQHSVLILRTYISAIIFYIT